MWKCLLVLVHEIGGVSPLNENEEALMVYLSQIFIEMTETSQSIFVSFNMNLYLIWTKCFVYQWTSVLAS